jgi:hypothetical protein
MFWYIKSRKIWQPWAQPANPQLPCTSEGVADLAQNVAAVGGRQLTVEDALMKAL